MNLLNNQNGNNVIKTKLTIKHAEFNPLFFALSILR